MQEVHVKGKEDGKCSNFPALHAVSGWREELAHPKLASTKYSAFILVVQ